MCSEITVVSPTAGNNFKINLVIGVLEDFSAMCWYVETCVQMGLHVLLVLTAQLRYENCIYKYNLLYVIFSWGTFLQRAIRVHFQLIN